MASRGSLRFYNSISPTGTQISYALNRGFWCHRCSPPSLFKIPFQEQSVVFPPTDVSAEVQKSNQILIPIRSNANFVVMIMECFPKDTHYLDLPVFLTGFDTFLSRRKGIMMMYRNEGSPSLHMYMYLLIRK